MSSSVPPPVIAGENNQGTGGEDVELGEHQQTTTLASNAPVPAAASEDENRTRIPKFLIPIFPSLGETGTSSTDADGETAAQTNDQPAQNVEKQKSGEDLEIFPLIPIERKAAQAGCITMSITSPILFVISLVQLVNYSYSFSNGCFYLTSSFGLWGIYASGPVVGMTVFVGGLMFLEYLVKFIPPWLVVLKYFLYVIGFFIALPFMLVAGLMIKLYFFFAIFMIILFFSSTLPIMKLGFVCKDGFMIFTEVLFWITLLLGAIAKAYFNSRELLHRRNLCIETCPQDPNIEIEWKSFCIND
jgi:hypothetical protein